MSTHEFCDSCQDSRSHTNIGLFCGIYTLFYRAHSWALVNSATLVKSLPVIITDMMTHECDMMTHESSLAVKMTLEKSLAVVMTHECDMSQTLVKSLAVRMTPPKNGVIALWPNKRVVKCKYYVSQKQNGFNNKIHWYSILLTLIFKFTARL